MAKIHPLTPIHLSSPPSSCSSSYVTKKKESFTVWMKSLVMQGNGCTVFNEDGEIVYRVDNYDKKSSNEVYLMDLKGNVLFTIRRSRSKLGLFRQWKGYYRCDDDANLKNQRPFFQVQKNCKFFQQDPICEVTLQSTSNGHEPFYRLENLGDGKSGFRVVKNRGEVVAEAKRKELSSGVSLGDDVLNLVVEAQIDHSLIMALAIVYGLMHHRM